MNYGKKNYNNLEVLFPHAFNVSSVDSCVTPVGDIMPITHIIFIYLCTKYSILGHLNLCSY